MAAWPSKGDILSNSPHKNIGQVQHFIKHSVWCNIEGKMKEFIHILAYVNWYKQHEHSNWFGISAIVTQTEFEQDSPFQFLPVQRIQSRCAYGKLKLELSSGYVETVHVHPQ